MMRGLTATLEKHHKVEILEEAVADSVRLSHRYITDRQLPDKSVSLLDTACARIALGQSATPPALEDCRREIEHLDIELGILEREKAVGRDHEERLGEAREQKTAAETRLADLEKRWAREKELVTKIQEVRARLEGDGQPGADGKDGSKKEARAETRAPAMKAPLASETGTRPPLAAEGGEGLGVRGPLKPEEQKKL